MPDKDVGGKPRIFKSPEDMEEKIISYFNSISSYEDIKKPVPTKFNKRGEPTAWEQGLVYNNNGQVARKLIWFDVPTLTGLAIYLGINPATLHVYKHRKGEGYDKVINQALTVIEDVWSKRLYELGNTRGAIFNLSCNFGWSDDPEEQRKKKKELSASADEQPLTLIDKLKYISEHAKVIAPSNDSTDQTDHGSDQTDQTDHGSDGSA